MKLLLFAVTLSLSRYYATSFPFATAALVNLTIDDSDVVFSYSPFASWQWLNNASCSNCLRPNLTRTFQQTLHYAIHASGPDADDAGKSSLLPSASEAPVASSSALPSSPAPSLSAPPSSSSAPPPSSSAPSPSSPAPSPSSPAPPPSSLAPPPSSALAPSSSPAPSSSSPAAAAVVPTTNQANVAASSSVPPTSTNSGDGGDGKGKGTPSARDLTNLRRTDADDPNFVDVNMTATINFTGSAVYVFCAVPVQTNNASILALTNLTFFLDDYLVGNYTHQPTVTNTSSTNGFQYQVMVFSKAGLSDASHVLVIKPALGSMVLLDFVQYTTLDSSSASASTPQATSSGSVESKSSSSSKKNTATFAIAIGSTMGVLAVLSFAVFVSICRRRRKSTKREKEREAMESAMRPPSPEMRGPQPFIPRYFPGNTPPRQSLSPPPFSPLSLTSSRDEESGPSHGLDYPPAPEHLGAPAYSPPPLVLSEGPSSPVSHLPPVTRMPLQREQSDPPRYQDVGRTQLVSIRTFTHAPFILPGMVEPTPTPSSSSRAESEDAPSSSSSASSLPECSDANHGESTARHTIISSIHANPHERPG